MCWSKIIHKTKTTWNFRIPRWRRKLIYYNEKFFKKYLREKRMFYRKIQYSILDF